MEKGFEREVLDRLKAIEVKLDDYNNIKDKSDEAHTLSKENKKDIEEINDKIRWLSRTVIGALLTGLIGLVIIYLKMGMGIK